MSIGTTTILTTVLMLNGVQSDPVQPYEPNGRADRSPESVRTDALKVWIGELRSYVIANWDEPKMAPNLTYPCAARVIIEASGHVSSVTFPKPCGDPLEKSIEEAICDSSPLPVPSDPRQFTSNLLLNFMPKGQ
jgi:hypothetical protein